MKLHIPSLLFCFLLITILSTTGCSDKEDAFKNPTSVVFNMGMNYQGTGGSDDLTFEKGYIILSNFSVIGKRSGAEDFEFTRTFSNGLKIPFNNSLTFDDLNFELPQGNYDELIVRFETQENNGINFFVEGDYIYNNPNKTPSIVYLEWDASQSFEVNVTDALGNKDLILTEDQLETPKIIFRPKSWFVNTTEMMLENASFVTISVGKQIMTINNTTNTTLFTKVDAEVGTSLVCNL